ncbi:MAG: curlin [Bacteroidia bacterium]|nr:curlin [Bacteroidia bacterium]
MKLVSLMMILVMLALTGCAASLASLGTSKATMGYTTAIHKELISLPPPETKIVVAVYKFGDQTGQYKSNSTATTFSTAVSQGNTSVLIKALEDSGWFVAIEREALANLLTERKIIRSTRENYQQEIKEQKKEAPPLPSLPPLLYAAVMLEGGIISYDTNLVTGGLGVRYFGVGGSAAVRLDQMSIYLRAVSTLNGAVLKSVSTTKSILSREADLGLYRFVRFKRLLEAEAGFSTNEPSQMCVQEAIEKAVHDLIIEGVVAKLWNLKNPDDMKHPLIQNYLKEKQDVEVKVKVDKEGNLVVKNPSSEEVKYVKEGWKKSE